MAHTLLSRRHFAALAAASASLGFGSGGCAAPDPLAFVNPEFQGALKGLLPYLMRASPQSLADRRKGIYRRPLAPPPAPQPETRLIPGPKGAPDVRVYVLGTTPGQDKPAVLHIHGGGFISGSAADTLRDNQDLAQAQDCVVISVDYRLAPETPFPGSLEDNYAALRWLYANADMLGVDRTRIAVKGESAGGGHAAMLAIAARDRGEVPLVLQVLIYPMLDDRTGSVRQPPPQIGQFIWTAADNRLGWSALLGRPAGSVAPPSGAVPARLTNLAGLPSAFIGVGSIDLFLEEDIDYARRLALAGVASELMVVPGGFHGFDLFSPGASLTQQFNRSWREALRRAFARPPAPSAAIGSKVVGALP